MIFSKIYKSLEPGRSRLNPITPYIKNVIIIFMIDVTLEENAFSIILLWSDLKT